MTMAEVEQSSRIKGRARGQWLGATVIVATVAAAVLLGIFGTNSYLAGSPLLLPIILQIIHRTWRAMTE